MPTCITCGFDRVPDDGACPLCGRSAAEHEPETPTIALGESGSGGVGGGVTLAEGTRIGDRFEVEGLLGRGGMGSVYRVRDTDGTPRALKVIKPDELDTGERFRREIEILAKVDTPAVPKVFGWGKHGEAMYFVCELVDGRDLRSILDERKRLPASEAAAIAATIADALAVAHHAGVIHRDVKPHNVMIEKDGRVRLLDFGVARSVGLDMKTITKTGMIVGTPEYMSPEQLDSHRVDERSDLYSLGVVLFELVTGRTPFHSETPVGVAMKHLSEKPPRPRELRPDVPGWLEGVILRCLEKDPAKRFLSAEALATELRKARTGAGRPVWKSLASGDRVLVDGGEMGSWALILESPGERGEWKPGMALRFEDRYFELREVRPPAQTGWFSYRFRAWPEEAVFRQLVDYDTDAAARSSRREISIGDRLKRFLPGAKSK